MASIHYSVGFVCILRENLSYLVSGVFIEILLVTLILNLPILLTVIMYHGCGWLMFHGILVPFGEDRKTD